MFTIARVGPFSEALQELSSGDRLWVRGPFGHGYTTGTGRALLVGGGYGAAPLFFLAQALLGAQARASGPAPIVALGARTSADLLFIKRFEALGLDVHIATEDGSAGTKGLVTDTVRKLIETDKIDRLHACGPEAMLDALASLCRPAGIPAELSHEAYMRCGIGLCGSCEHGARLVCVDGPVFTITP
jgi:dihydroorotate dehydrogenase electron transfer subunit